MTNKVTYTEFIARNSYGYIKKVIKVFGFVLDGENKKEAN